MPKLLLIFAVAAMWGAMGAIVTGLVWLGLVVFLAAGLVTYLALGLCDVSADRL